MPGEASAIEDKETGQIYEETAAALIKYLVFKGGGIRGIAYAGFIEVLEKVGMLADLKHIAGSSIGAVAAMVVALGATGDEIKELFENLSFEDFLEDGKPWRNLGEGLAKVKQGLSILTKKHFSLSSGDRFLAWIEKFIEKKLGSKDATFADLAQRVENTPGNKYKYLSVTGTNVSRNRLEVYNHITEPHTRIADAVRASGAVPIVLKPVYLKRMDEVLVEKRETESGTEYVKEKQEVIDTIVDGGVMNNLPTFLFNDTDCLPEGKGFNDKGGNTAILAVRVETEDEKRDVLHSGARPKIITSLTDFGWKLLNGALSPYAGDQLPTNTVQIEDCGLDSLKFDINADEKKMLVEAGREAAWNWLAAHLNEADKIKVYKNQEEWLKAKDFNELVAIRDRYQAELARELDELQKLSQTTESVVEGNLKQKIKSIEEYIQCRLAKKPEDEQANISLLPHIDLPPIKSRQERDVQLKNALFEKLRSSKSEILRVAEKIDEVIAKSELNKKQEHLHNYLLFEHTVYLTQLEEKLKFLRATKRQLELNLNLLKCDLLKISVPPDENNLSSLPINANAAYVFTEKQLYYVNRFDNICIQLEIKENTLNQLDEILKQAKNPSRKILSIENLEQITSITGYSHLGKIDQSHVLRRNLFHFHLRGLLSQKSFARSPHINLANMLEKHLYNISASYLTDENAKVTLDFKQRKDFEIYIMACAIYLRFINCGDALFEKVKEIYQDLFSTSVIPSNLEELRVALQQENIDLLLSAYRIEGLVKNFMRLDKPTQNLSGIDLDYIFTALSPETNSKTKIFWRKKEGWATNLNNAPGDIELPLIDRPFSGLSMFQRSESNSNLMGSKGNLELERKKEDKLPKGMRRMSGF